MFFSWIKNIENALTVKKYSPNKNILEKFHLCGPANKDSLSILDATRFG